MFGIIVVVGVVLGVVGILLLITVRKLLWVSTPNEVLIFSGTTRTIGDKSWLRTGATWQEESQAELGVLTPLVVCNDIVREMSSSLGVVKPQEEDVDGVAAEHYRLEQTELQELPRVLGPGAPEHYTVDVWLAKDGSWPVQLKIGSSEVSETGEPLGFGLTMLIRDIGDRGIHIDPPAAGGGGRE